MRCVHSTWNHPLTSRRSPLDKAYGVALRELGHANTDVVVLDADVCNSTFAQWFRDDPGSRIAS